MNYLVELKERLKVIAAVNDILHNKIPIDINQYSEDELIQIAEGKPMLMSIDRMGGYYNGELKDRYISVNEQYELLKKIYGLPFWIMLVDDDENIISHSVCVNSLGEYKRVTYLFAKKYDDDGYLAVGKIPNININVANILSGCNVYVDSGLCIDSCEFSNCLLKCVRELFRMSGRKMSSGCVDYMKSVDGRGLMLEDVDCLCRRLRVNINLVDILGNKLYVHENKHKRKNYDIILRCVYGGDIIYDRKNISKNNKLINEYELHACINTGWFSNVKSVVKYDNYDEFCSKLQSYFDYAGYITRIKYSKNTRSIMGYQDGDVFYKYSTYNVRNNYDKDPMCYSDMLRCADWHDTRQRFYKYIPECIIGVDRNKSYLSAEFLEYFQKYSKVPMWLNSVDVLGEEFYVSRPCWVIVKNVKNIHPIFIKMDYLVNGGIYFSVELSRIKENNLGYFEVDLVLHSDEEVFDGFKFRNDISSNEQRIQIGKLIEKARGDQYMVKVDCDFDKFYLISKLSHSNKFQLLESNDYYVVYQECNEDVDKKIRKSYFLHSQILGYHYAACWDMLARLPADKVYSWHRDAFYVVDMTKCELDECVEWSVKPGGWKFQTKDIRKNPPPYYGDLESGREVPCVDRDFVKKQDELYQILNKGVNSGVNCHVDRLIVFEGPGGSGKSTRAISLLPTGSTIITLTRNLRDEHKKKYPQHSVMTLAFTESERCRLSPYVLIDDVGICDPVYVVKFVNRLLSENKLVMLTYDPLQCTPVGSMRKLHEYKPFYDKAVIVRVNESYRFSDMNTRQINEKFRKMTMDIPDPDLNKVIKIPSECNNVASRVLKKSVKLCDLAIHQKNAFPDDEIKQFFTPSDMLTSMNYHRNISNYYRKYVCELYNVAKNMLNTIEFEEFKKLKDKNVIVSLNVDAEYVKKECVNCNVKTIYKYQGVTCKGELYIYASSNTLSYCKELLYTAISRVEDINNIYLII